MDNTIRRNENCIIRLPRCGYVFSSTRSCFIAYGYKESSLEKDMLREILKEHGIQPEETGDSLAPGQSAFCAKICSKIILSQFCIVLLNNEIDKDIEVPNANVNMEYGLMLGFTKYVIPFQRESQDLPFNVAGLDTVKYTDQNFKGKAISAIDQAIKETQQDNVPPINPDQTMEAFLLTKRSLITPLLTAGDKDLYSLGLPLGFYLLNDFSGLKYMYFGDFAALRPEVVVWRLETLREIIDGRRKSLGEREKIGMVKADKIKSIDELLSKLEIWVVVTSEDDKKSIVHALKNSPINYDYRIYSKEDVKSDLEKLGDKIG